MATESALNPEQRVGARVRRATRADLPRIVEIYNYYVINTPITFDLEPWTLESRQLWFDQFSESGRYQLLVYEEAGRVVAYAGTTSFRVKAAYERTVETTIYCDPSATGRGIGNMLYERLFDAVVNEDIHLAIAGITLPNNASLALHKRFGFEPAGVMHDVGFKLGQYWDVGWFEKRMR